MMEENLRKKICGIVQEVMQVDISALNPKTEFSTIAAWDSFNNLMLVSRFEEEFGVKFTAVEVEQTKTVGDLFSLMERKTKR